jgi:hypothetical protein
MDVTTTMQAGLAGASDLHQLEFCLKEDRVILTHDRDFLRMSAAGVPHSGIAFCEKDKKSVGEIIQGLVVIWEILEPDEIRGRVEFL